MTEFLKGLMTVYKSTAGVALRNVTGPNLFLEHAIQSAPSPWVVVSIASGNIAWVMGNPPSMYTQDLTVTFKICSNENVTQCFTALPLLTALYDSNLMTLSGYTHILMQRTREFPTRDYDSEGYIIFVDYHAIVGH